MEWETVETTGKKKQWVNPDEPIVYTNKGFFVMTRKAYELMGNPKYVTLVKNANFLGFKICKEHDSFSRKVIHNGNLFRVSCVNFMKDHNFHKPGRKWLATMNQKGDVLFFDALEPLGE